MWFDLPQVAQLLVYPSTSPVIHPPTHPVCPSCLLQHHAQMHSRQPSLFAGAWRQLLPRNDDPAQLLSLKIKALSACLAGEPVLTCWGCCARCALQAHGVGVGTVLLVQPLRLIVDQPSALHTCISLLQWASDVRRRSVP